MKLGSAFSDSISAEHKTVRRSRGDPSWWFGSGRVIMFATIFVLLFAILIFRLFELTIIQGHRYRLLADGNRTREIIRHAPRGILRDRTGAPLVVNIPQYRLVGPCGQGEVSISCSRHISKEEGETLEKKGHPVGSYLEVDYTRDYSTSMGLSHVVGYTGELSQKELTDPYYVIRNYKQADRVGRTGAEAVFEEKLRGRDGKELVEVTADGKVVRTLGRDPEIPGEDVMLSVDKALSTVAEQTFPKDKKGAVIVSKPSTGEILSMYSSPSYSLNEFSFGMNEQDYQALLTNPDQPMFNRAIGGVYPPGSTFKMIVAAAGLEEQIITKDTVVEDTGIITIGPFSFTNWYFTGYGKTDGLVDVVKAIARSNDIFFYTIGNRIGIDTISAWAQKFGLGKPLGIELSGEASGLMPDPAWKKQQFTSPQDLDARNDQWYTGDTYHVAIGQGYTLATPLQVNIWTNIIASDGRLCKPTIEKVESGKFKIQSCKSLGMKNETIDIIIEGMKKACEEGGTGWPFFKFKVQSSKFKSNENESSSSSELSTMIHEPSTVTVPVACKTGTAEFGDAKNKTHAWFTAFGPLASQGESLQGISGDPEISVTVLVEEGGEGSSVAGPIAKKIFEEWFGR